MLPEPASGLVTRHGALRSLFEAVLDNPVLYREGLLRAVRRARDRVQVYTATGIVLFTTFVSLWAFAMSPNDTVPTGYWLVVLWAAVTVITSSLHLARMIVQARQQGTWDGLLMTRLRPVDIILGKLLGALFPFWASWVLLLPSLVLIFGGNGVAVLVVVAKVLQVFVGTVLLSLAFASLALYCSMRSRTIGNAYSQTLVAMVGTWVFGMGLQHLASCLLVTSERAAGLFYPGMWLRVMTQPWLLLELLVERLSERGASVLFNPWLFSMCVPGVVALVLLLVRFKQMDRAHRH